MKRISIYPIRQERVFSYEMAADAEVLCLDTIENHPVVVVLESMGPQVPQGMKTFMLAEPGGKFEEPPDVKQRFIGMIHYKKSAEAAEESLLLLFEREVRILLG